MSELVLDLQAELQQLAAIGIKGQTTVLWLIVKDGTAHRQHLRETAGLGVGGGLGECCGHKSESRRWQPVIPYSNRSACVPARTKITKPCLPTSSSR